MMPKKMLVPKLAARRSKYASGSRAATRTDRFVSTASCVAKDAVLGCSRRVAERCSPAVVDDGSSTPYAAPLRSAHLSSTARTPATGVKSLLTRSNTYSATLVSAPGGYPIVPRYSPKRCALPKYATRPMLRIIVLSKSANTDAGGWWIVHATAMLISAAMFFRKVIIRIAEAESTPLVGSSRKRMAGDLTRASATERRRLLPLDSPRVISLPPRTSWKS
mmetsp:Transcript_24758/g.80942  ORF Transcript_24758/g.80942 Transcript_24758/m.80942 type:complete len:220 (-) Transcript_24758:566-1225(-)